MVNSVDAFFFFHLIFSRNLSKRLKKLSKAAVLLSSMMIQQ